MSETKKTTDICKELYEYATRIVEKKEVACRKYQWACMRFIRDVDNSKKKTFDWIFDNHGANQYFKWMQLFKHSKGPLAGLKKIPNPYERFVYGNIYGWINRHTKKRRFRRSYEQVGRKNAKSQDKAIQALYEISQFGEPMAEAYIAATKKEQTRFVWGEAAWLIENSELLKNKFTCKYDRDFLQVVIKHKKSGSVFSRLSKDDKKSGDGTNPHFVVLDEYHLHETTEYYDLATSGQKTREQPLLSIITTAGFDLNNPCYRIEYDYISKILDPNNPIENDRYFAVVCEVDRNETTETIEIDGRKIPPGEPIDELDTIDAIKKSNPVIWNDPVGVESIKYELKEAMDKPEKMRDVLTKTFNFWVNQREAGYMDMARWVACGEPDRDKLPDVGKNCRKNVFCGVDLSSTIDLTSVAFVINLPDRKHYVRHHSFMPQEAVDRRSKQDNARYDLWIKQGWITATAGAEVDYHAVLQYIVEQYAKNNWDKGEVAFDKHLATWLEHELDILKFTPVEISQSYSGLSLATKELRAKVYDKKIIHDDDPVLNWTMGNAVIRCGPSENIMLDKAAARFRIDPVAALINAMVRAIANEIVESKFEKMDYEEIKNRMAF